jgi:hypothetical protein
VAVVAVVAGQVMALDKVVTADQVFVSLVI